MVIESKSLALLSRRVASNTISQFILCAADMLFQSWVVHVADALSGIETWEG